MTRHQYYHRVGGSAGGQARPGAPPSTHTPYYDDEGELHQRSNSQVVSEIKTIQDDDDLRCGYKRMTAQLQLRGYHVNAKKVYRLMKQHGQLLDRRRSERGPYVSQRCARPDRPLTLLEMDIKMFWVEEHRRHAFVLTIIDTFTRVALAHEVGYSMKWTTVAKAWEDVITNHLQPADLLAKDIHVEVRSDNGPQFLATRLREFMADNHLSQVYTHPYTPQENGHVESFHSIISRALQYDRFMTLKQLEQRLIIFYENYNNSRVHSATAMLPPGVFWQAYEAGLVTSRKGKRDKLIFSLTIPRYLVKQELGLARGVATEVPDNHKKKGQSQPKAEAVQQQKTVLLCGA